MEKPGLRRGKDNARNLLRRSEVNVGESNAINGHCATHNINLLINVSICKANNMVPSFTIPVRTCLSSLDIACQDDIFCRHIPVNLT
jgi:hypothetical protein